MLNINSVHSVIMTLLCNRVGLNTKEGCHTYIRNKEYKANQTKDSKEKTKEKKKIDECKGRSNM